MTGALVLGRAAAALVTRADFSFLRTVPVVGSLAALGVVIVAAFVTLLFYVIRLFLQRRN